MRKRDQRFINIRNQRRVTFDTMPSEREGRSKNELRQNEVGRNQQDRNDQDDQDDDNNEKIMPDEFSFTEDQYFS